ncbi:hypothetical protein K8T06_09925 [bacterium]|nr:hypothetical protein [bacterium]
MKKFVFLILIIAVVTVYCVPLLAHDVAVSNEESRLRSNKCATIWLQEEYGKYFPETPRGYTDLPCDHTPVGPPATVAIGSEWDWYIWSLNGMPEAELKPCTVRGSSEHAWLVVENTQWDVNVNQADVDEILNYFENESIGSFPSKGIWDLNIGHFGIPPDYLDQDGKIYIFYYDFDISADGYFWSFDQGCDGSGSFSSNECDAIYLNCSDNSPSGDYMVAVLAHEFQHLIHYEQDANEASWVDEGCAELAMWLFGHPDHISMFNTNPDNNLTEWNGKWSDYIKTYLWTLYFYEQFGGESSIFDFVSEQANGINGFENFFVDHGYSATFAHYFSQWTVANYLDDCSIETGQFGYAGDNLPAFSTIAEHSTYPVTQSTTVNHWATDYVKFTSSTPLTIKFQGEDAAKFTVWAVEMDATNETRVTKMVLDSVQDGEITLFDLGTDYTEVIMVFAGTSTSGGKTYSYTASESTAEPTVTPTATTTPAPTATPWYGDDPDMQLVLNSALYGDGDDFILGAKFWNPEVEPLHVDTFIVLAVLDYYWFWPSWVYIDDGIDFSDMFLASQVVSEENILTFTWPTGTGEASDICFLGAILDHETAEFYGSLAQACFDYQ